MNRKYPMTTVEHCLVLSIYELKRRGFLDQLRGTQAEFEWKNYFEVTKGRAKLFVTEDLTQVHLSHEFSELGSKRTVESDGYSVSLASLDCRYGGNRFYFICPLWKHGVYCGRKVAKLYCPPGAKFFGCRYCHDLSYDSRQMYQGGIQWAITKHLELSDSQMHESSELSSRRINRIGRQLRSLKSREP